METRLGWQVALDLVRVVPDLEQLRVQTAAYAMTGARVELDLEKLTMAPLDLLALLDQRTMTADAHAEQELEKLAVPTALDLQVALLDQRTVMADAHVEQDLQKGWVVQILLLDLQVSLFETGARVEHDLEKS